MITRSIAFLFSVFIFTSALVAHSFTADQGKLIMGKWKVSTPARDADGSPCPLVPDDTGHISNRLDTGNISEGAEIAGILCS